MVGQIWVLLKESVNSFLEDEALTRCAAIAFYTVTSIGPVLFIVVAIAGLVFGSERRHVRSVGQLEGAAKR
jgi:membrane protein